MTEYVAGLRAVEASITDGQRRLLLAHHAAPAGTPTATKRAADTGLGSSKR